MLRPWVRRITLAVISLGSAQAEVRLTGTVESATHEPLAGVRLFGRMAGGSASWAAVSDVRGAFAVEIPQSGIYQVVADRPGYFPLRTEIAIQADHTEATFTFERVREHIESFSVVATPDAIDADTSTANRSLGSPEIANIPYPNTNDLKSALRILPGVIRDNRGGLHILGGAEEQTLYTLNGFNLNDPLSGRFETRFSVEAVQNAEVSSGNLPAEFGKGAAGALAIRSQSGDDRFRFSATNFVPGFENRKGWMVGDWTPRFGVSGPIARGRAWFSNSSDVLYANTVVRELAKGSDRTASLRWSDMVTAQVNLAPAHILHAGALASYWSAARTGLTALDPPETTIDKRSRQWFAHIKDQVYFGHGALVEFGYAANRTSARDNPQGPGMLVFTPFGKRGNHFVDAARAGARDQILLNAFLPAFTLAGSHQLKAGTDLNRVAYSQDARRTGYEQISESGARLYRTVFAGSGRFRRRNYEAAAYLQDSWRVRRGLLIEGGYRLDWDALLRRWSSAPRVGLVWSPDSRRTKVYGGISRVFDLSGLRVFTRPQDQVWLTTYFFPDGGIARGPALSVFTIGGARLARPRYETGNLGVEHHWSGGLSMRGDYSYRRGVRGFTYLNTVDDPEENATGWAAGYGARVVDAVMNLTNDRRDAFRSYAITVRHTLRKQYQWLASYTRSRALSNAVVDLNADDPVTVLRNAGPMPWDSPHRFVSWGYLPLPLKNWAVAFLADARSGFPYSVRDNSGGILGLVNAERYPTFFEINVHFERRFPFRGHLWALRVGVNNLTGRINPDSVNNISGSPEFGRFYGGSGRSTNVRIRWLGRGKQLG